MITQPQKALHLFQELDKKKPKCIGNRYAIFEKYDGWFGILNYGAFIQSRNCRNIPSLLEFSRELNSMMPSQGTLIFEIMVKGVTDFHTMNGILNRSKGDCEARDAYIMVHDFIPWDEADAPFGTRYLYADSLVHQMRNDRVKIARILGISDQVTEWKRFAEEAWSKGKEGVILKNCSAPYQQDKRNYNLMKIKEEVDADLLVIGMEKGEGKYADTLGALVLMDKCGNNTYVSGMSDEERHKWWNNEEEIVGKVVQVKAMKKLADGKLREPRFKAVRYDKSPDQID